MRNELNSAAQHKFDAKLVRGAQQVDGDAFTTLFNTHKTKVYAICLRMTGNTAEAEDLTQDVFLQVFRKLASFRGDAALSTWIHRVAINIVLMHFRKKGLHQLSLDEPVSQAAGSPKREFGKIDDRLSGSVDRLALIRAMKELPAGYRNIFVLHEVDGYEHQEIARRLCCSIGNSKSQLHKAKSRMRTLLGLSALQKPLAGNKTKTRNTNPKQPEWASLRKPIEHEAGQQVGHVA